MRTKWRQLDCATVWQRPAVSTMPLLGLCVSVPGSFGLLMWVNTNTANDMVGTVSLVGLIVLW